MSEKRRALGRGLGALIPSSPSPATGAARPVDVFFRDSGHESDHASVATMVEPESGRPAEPWYDDLTPTAAEDATRLVVRIEIPDDEPAPVKVDEEPSA